MFFLRPEPEVVGRSNIRGGIGVSIPASVPSSDAVSRIQRFVPLQKKRGTRGGVTAVEVVSIDAPIFFLTIGRLFVIRVYIAPVGAPASWKRFRRHRG